MNITINNEPMAFELENEKNLGDVAQAVQSWLDGSGFEIISLSTDGKILDPDRDPQWPQILLTEVDLFNIEARPIAERRIQGLQTAHQDLSILLMAVEKENPGVLPQIGPRLPGILADLSTLTGSGCGETNPDGDALKKLIENAGLFTEEWGSKESLDELTEYLKKILFILSDRMKEYLNPQSELKGTIRLLSELRADLEETSIQLQTGHDDDAITTILRFIELSQKLNRILTVLHHTGSVDFNQAVLEDQSFNQFYLEYNGILNELIEAFDAGDTVLIGDLLEYEVAVRLEKLEPFSELIAGRSA